MTDCVYANTLHRAIPRYRCLTRYSAFCRDLLIFVPSVKVKDIDVLNARLITQVDINYYSHDAIPFPADIGAVCESRSRKSTAFSALLHTFTRARASKDKSRKSKYRSNKVN